MGVKDPELSSRSLSAENTTIVLHYMTIVVIDGDG